MLTPATGVVCDRQELERNISDGRLADAADTVREGFACGQITGITDALDDWIERYLADLRSRIATQASARWESSRGAGDWTSARDAAEARHAIYPKDPEAVANVIEARARVGRLQAAEVAYAEFEVDGAAEDLKLVDDAIRRVRTLSGSRPSVEGPNPAVPFVGRKTPLSVLNAIFDEVRSGNFSFALVAGEAGIGKTRLIREVERSARLEGFRCLSAEPVELERRISMNPIIDALAAVDLKPHLSAIGEPWRTVIGTMLPPGPHSESVQALPPIQERSLSRRLLDAFSLLFQSLADEQPTLFFLDDLQWADATTVAALQFYQRRWNESFFGVVATVRPTLVGKKDPAAPYLSAGDKLGVLRVELEELSGEEARDLVGILGNHDIDPSAISKLCALSGRHPLYLTELTRDYLSGRLTLPESEADAFNIPISLKQILTSRIEAIGEEARSVLQILAVGSRPMRLGDLAEILTLSLDSTADAAERLRSRQLVEISRDQLWIAHELFRTAIYRDLREAHRAVLHHRLAEHIRTHSGEEAASELATHFDRAGRTESSAEYGWVAAERAFERGAVAEAAHFYELVTRNEHDPQRRAEATAMLATSLHLNRDISRANPALELASTRLRSVGMTKRARRMDIRRVEGLAEAGDTPVDELIDRLGAIKEECRATEDWEGVALVLDAELGLRHSDGDFAGIQTTFEEMRELTKTGPIEAQAVCHSGLAMGVLFGDPSEALASAEKAVRLTREVRKHRLRALLRLMVALQLKGRLHQPRAIPIVEEARQLAQSSGDVRIRFSVESNLAVAWLDAGELDKAQHMLDESTKLLGSADMDLPRFNQANNYAELALAQSDYARAERCFREAASYLGPTTPPYAHDLVDAGLGLCALEAGSIREAQKREDLLREPHPPWHFDPSTLVTFQVRLLELRGSYVRAAKLLSESANDLEGRLDLAWLKINRLRLQKASKWSRHNDIEGLADRCITLSQSLSLRKREEQFTQLRRDLAKGRIRERELQ